MAISRMRFLFDLSGVTPDGNGVRSATYYIDTAQCLSIHERKLHPQFREYQIMGGLIKDSNNDSVVRMNVAPHTWYTKNALRRGKRIFDQMINQRLGQATDKINKSKYHDFKVLLNNNQSLDASTNALPCDASGNPYNVGEWQYSLFVSEDVDWSAIVNDLANSTSTPGNRNADEFYGMIVGGTHIAGTGTGQDSWSRISLVKSWLETRPQPTADPVVDGTAVTTDPLANLFDETDADDEVIANLTTRQDEPPYDVDTCPGIEGGGGTSQNLQRVAMAATQSGAGQISGMNGFSALCGLIQVHITQSAQDGGQVELLLDVNTKGGKI